MSYYDFIAGDFLLVSYSKMVNVFANYSVDRIFLLPVPVYYARELKPDGPLYFCSSAVKPAIEEVVRWAR